MALPIENQIVLREILKTLLEPFMFKRRVSRQIREKIEKFIFPSILRRIEEFYGEKAGVRPQIRVTMWEKRSYVQRETEISLGEEAIQPDILELVLAHELFHVFWGGRKYGKLGLLARLKLALGMDKRKKHFLNVLKMLDEFQATLFSLALFPEKRMERMAFEVWGKRPEQDLKHKVWERSFNRLVALFYLKVVGKDGVKELWKRRNDPYSLIHFILEHKSEVFEILKGSKHLSKLFTEFIRFIELCREKTSA